MSNRVRRIIEAIPGDSHTRMPWSGTFHAMGARLIGEYAEDIGLNRSFTVLDQSDAADLMNLVRQDLGLSAKESPFPTKNTCLSIYSFAVNSRMPLKKVLANHFSSWARWKRELRKLFRCYKAAKRRQNVIDYDDLLLYWAEIMDDAHLATEIRSRFDHVLVDEYQDTNRLQAESRSLSMASASGCVIQSLVPGSRSIVSRMAFAKLLVGVLPMRDPPHTRSWLYLATRRSRRQSATRVKRIRYGLRRKR